MPHYFVVPQSLAKILVPTVFSTKDRRPFLRDKPLREELPRCFDFRLASRGMPKSQHKDCFQI
jgi:hypothetical protein